MPDISTYYGGSVLAIKGSNSIALISDKRLGQNSITTSTSFTRIHKIGPRTFVGLSSFVPDNQMLLKKILKNYNLFVLNENREMEPEEVAHMVSFILYSKRFTPYFSSVIVGGVGKSGAYLCSMDQLGCMDVPGDFVACGTAEKNLMGLCEALYYEQMGEEELFVMGAQAFLNAVDRDALSGWGAECYLISKERVIKRNIKGRQD